MVDSFQLQVKSGDRVKRGEDESLYVEVPTARQIETNKLKYGAKVVLVLQRASLFIEAQ
jgi:hypothetical protein